MPGRHNASDSGLRAAVGRAVGAPAASIEDVRREPLAYDAFQAGRSVVRVSGMAVTGDGAVPWSMIEKVTQGPSVASAYLYDNGLREFRAYESGLLDELLPSVAAPAAFGVEEGPDGRLTLWLEELRRDRAEPSAADVLATARDLGTLAGRWLDRVPRYPWLFNGWIDRHSQPEASPRALSRLRGIRSRSAVEARLGWGIDEAIQLIEDQATFRSALERAPQTLCHHDAVAANVFRRAKAQDAREASTVLIDWEMVGPGAIGADLASLLFASARRGDSSADAVPELIPSALEAYASGMREVGAPAAAGALPIAFHAAIALRWTLARDVILALEDGTPVFRGSAPGESPDEAIGELIALTRVLFASAGEARRLAG